MKKSKSVCKEEIYTQLRWCNQNFIPQLDNRDANTQYKHNNNYSNNIL